MTEQLEQIVEELRTISIKDFDTPPERIAKGYVNLTGIYLLAKKCMRVGFLIGSPKIDFIGNEEFDFDLRTNYSECPDLKNPCRSREINELSKIKMVITYPIGATYEYTFKEEGDSRHTEYDGGENVSHIFLKMDKKPVLMSAQYLSYETNHSDEDFPLICIRRTELLSEWNEVAKFIFGELKKPSWQEGLEQELKRR